MGSLISTLDIKTIFDYAEFIKKPHIPHAVELSHIPLHKIDVPHNINTTPLLNYFFAYLPHRYKYEQIKTTWNTTYIGVQNEIGRLC